MYSFLSGGYNHGGGAQTIQLSLFKSLSERGERCKLFDVKGGAVHKAFLETGINFEFIEIDKPKSKKDYSKHLTDNDLLIVFDTNFLGSLLYFSNARCKIIIWEIYYPWIERFLYKRNFPVKMLAIQQEKKILNEFVKHNAFYFIDYKGKETAEKRLNTKISDNFYLPIPVIVPAEKRELSGRETTKLMVTYVGRSVVWKINPFIKVLKDFIRYHGTDNVDFIVVCDNITTFKSSLQDKIEEFNQLSIKFYENLSQEDLGNILSNTDLHFAMGASALDGAKIGIPTVLIDASFYDFPENYRYRWIYETTCPILGVMIEQQVPDNKHTINDIINELKNNTESISVKCREYVIENYDIDIITEKLINYKSKAELSFKPFQNMLFLKYFKLLRQLGLE